MVWMLRNVDLQYTRKLLTPSNASRMLPKNQLWLLGPGSARIGDVNSLYATVHNLYTAVAPAITSTRPTICIMDMMSFATER